MKGLLVIAHGSRRAESNDEIRELAARVSVQAAGQFDHIDCAFLELAQPSIPEGIQSLVDKGVQSIVVMPYFLANGMHVAKDIPAFLKEASEKNPQIQLSVSPYIGAADVMPSLILDAAAKAN